MQCFCLTIPTAVRPSFSLQMDVGSLTCAQVLVDTHEGGSDTGSFDYSSDAGVEPLSYVPCLSGWPRAFKVCVKITSMGF